MGRHRTKAAWRLETGSTNLQRSGTSSVGHCYKGGPGAEEMAEFLVGFLWLLGSLQASTQRHCSGWAAGSWTSHSGRGAASCTAWQFGDMRYEQVKLYHWTVEEPGMMCWINAQRSGNLTPFPCHFPVPIRASTLNQSICGFPAIYSLGRKSDFRSVSLKCTHSSS